MMSKNFWHNNRLLPLLGVLFLACQGASAPAKKDDGHPPTLGPYSEEHHGDPWAPQHYQPLETFPTPIFSVQCDAESHPLDGVCVKQEVANAEINKRKKDALQRIKTSETLEESTEASLDYIETQIQQADYVESELDEIIHELKSRKEKENRPAPL